jgi:protoporphyrinogen/coproporphyrinogen III oxidase
MPKQVQALVVGAGISGLVTAYALQKSGIDVRIVELADRPGGVIRSVERDGYLIECGPQSFSGSASITALCGELNLLSERLQADQNAPRYILIDGKLQPVPMGPGIFLSSLFSGGTRGAILRDIFGKSRPPESDESVADFVRRKASVALLDRLVGPFVSGIYAGDPEKLSLRAAFPILYDAELNAGSVVRGAFRVMRGRKSARRDKHEAPREKPTLQTFRQGNEALIYALAARLGDRLVCNVQVGPISSLNEPPSGKGPQFRVNLRTAQGTETLEVERLVLAVPTDQSAKLLAPLDPSFVTPLAAVEYAAVAVVSLGYPRDDVGQDLNGFGFLVPRSSGLTVLGTVWNSSLFPGRAPEGHVLLTSFVGGATNPSITRFSEEQLAAQVDAEVSPVLSIGKKPVFSSVCFWPRAIPQYNLGHNTRIAAIESLRNKFPGLYIAGNYLNGPAIGACVERALAIANEIRASFAN